MKSTRLVAWLAVVSVACFSTAACSSSGDDDDDGAGGSSGSGGKGAGKAGESPSEAGGDNGGSAGKSNGTAGAPEGGTTGNGDEGGAPTTGGATGEAGSPATCEADTDTDPDNCGRCGHSCGGGECSDGACQPVALLDPEPRSVGRNVSLDVKNRVLVDGGSIYYWNYGSLPNEDFAYTILKASVVPTDPPSDGTPTLQNFVIDAAPIQGATFWGGFIYTSIKTGAATAEVRKKKLDTTDGTGGGAKVFSLDNGRVWRNIVFGADKVYVSGTVDSIMVDQIKTGIYSLAWPPANANAKPTAITGLATLDNEIADLTLIGDHLFWTEADDTTSHALLWTAPVTGGAPVMLEDVTQFGGASIAGDATHVYWTSHHHGGSLSRCPLATLDAQHVDPVDTVDNASEGLLLDAQYAYYMEDETLVSGKPIWRVPKVGGGRELLGEIPGGFALVGVDEGFVYAQDFDNVLYKLSKEP